MNKNPKYKFYADPRNRVDGTVLVYLSLRFDTRQFISTGIIVTSEQWAVIEDRRIKNDRTCGLTEREINSYRDTLDEYESRIKDLVAEHQKSGVPYTAKMLKEDFFTFKPASTLSLRLFDLYNETIERKRELNITKHTLDGYKDSLLSLARYYNYTKLNNKKYSNDEELYNYVRDLTIMDVDAVFIHAYEKFMLNPPKESKMRKLTISSIQTYIRPLKAVYNYAIGKGYIKQTLYPFNENNKDNFYRVKRSAKTKRALTEEQFLKLIDSTDLMTPAQKQAFDIFVLSFLINGANLIDIVQLEKRELDKDRNMVKFIRQKTKNTTSIMSEITVELNGKAQMILERNKQTDPNSKYLFNFINGIDNMELDEIKKKVGDLLRCVDRKLKLVAKKIEFEADFSYQWARHTFATLAVMNGVLPGELQIMLGHKDIKTTYNYISSLPLKENKIAFELKNKMTENFK